MNQNRHSLAKKISLLLKKETRKMSLKLIISLQREKQREKQREESLILTYIATLEKLFIVL